MPGLFSKISQFLKSPQGRKMTDSAKRYASDPKNRQKIQGMMRKRGGGGAPRH